MFEKEDAKRESPHVSLARAAIEAWVEEGREVTHEDSPELYDALQERAGTFVSLKKDGRLRGCIGTFRPTRKTLAGEITANAISAASRDPRFPPVSGDEIGDLDISVDVLGEPEPIPDSSSLDPRIYGVIVQRGPQTGLLLPDLEGVDGIEEQVSIARRKAGIDPEEPVQLYRFTVKRYH